MISITDHAGRTTNIEPRGKLHFIKLMPWRDRRKLRTWHAAHRTTSPNLTIMTKHPLLMIRPIHRSCAH